MPIMEPSWRPYVLWASAGCYAVALVLPAFSYGFHGAFGDTFSGFGCLWSPVKWGASILLQFPSWWANPIYWAGFIALYRRWDYTAIIAGLLSSVLAVYFALQLSIPASWQIFPDRESLGYGYWFWIGSMAIIPMSAAIGILTEHGGPLGPSEADGEGKQEPPPFDISSLPKFPGS